MSTVSTKPDDMRVWHPLQLPSMGRFYVKNGVSLCPEGMIEYALWTTEHEEILVRYGGMDGLADKMIRPNIRLPDSMEYEDLLVADQYFILLKLRAESLCPYITYQCKCHGCGKIYSPQCNLNELRVLDSSNVAEEPVECFLPHAKIPILLKYPRVADTIAIEKYQQDKDKIGGEGGVSFQYARQIEKIDGESAPFDTRRDFVRTLVMGDLRAIEMVLVDNDMGLDLSDESTCSHCETANVSGISLDKEFFRPSRTDIETSIRVAKESRRRD